MRRKVRGVMHSKTMWFSFALVVLGALYDNFSYIEQLINPRLYGILLICIGVAVAVLRFITTMPLEDK